MGIPDHGPPPGGGPTDIEAKIEAFCRDASGNEVPTTIEAIRDILREYNEKQIRSAHADLVKKGVLSTSLSLALPNARPC